MTVAIDIVNKKSNYMIVVPKQVEVLKWGIYIIWDTNWALFRATSGLKYWNNLGMCNRGRTGP
jgi:hypothetical protein